MPSIFSSLAEIEDSEIPFVAVPAMKSGDRLLVLYGDGHVESVDIPGWREMNLEQLENALK